jgi:hypothetical protein
MRADALDPGHRSARGVLELMRRVAREPYRVYAEDEFFESFALDPGVERAPAVLETSTERPSGAAARRHRVGVAALVVGAFGVVGGLIAADVLSSRPHAGGAPVARARTLTGMMTTGRATALARVARRTTAVPATVTPARAVARSKAPGRVLRAFADTRTQAVRRASSHRDSKRRAVVRSTEAPAEGAELAMPADGRPAVTTYASGPAASAAVAQSHRRDVEFGFER